MAEDRQFFEETILRDNEVWVAAKKKEILGYLAIRGDYVDRLYVAIDHQGEGVGTALLDLAKKRSPTGLRLFTHRKNEQACRFYERRGFHAVRYGVSPPPESEPDVEYQWSPDGPPSEDRLRTIQVYVGSGEDRTLLPVQAESLRPKTYRIVPTRHDATGTWQFKPGEVVRCEERRLPEGRGWVAVARIEKEPLPTLVIDGKDFRNLRRFYRALENTLRLTTRLTNLDQLNDVLRGGFGTPDRGFTLVWRNAALSRDRLGTRKASDGTRVRVFDEILEILQTHGPGGEEAEDNVHLELE